MAAANDSVPGELHLRPAVDLVADPAAQHEHRHPLGPGVERHHQLGARAHERRDRDVVRADRGAAGREAPVERRAVDRSRAEPVVQRPEHLGRVVLRLRPVEAGPPGEEHLGHEVEDELLGLLDRVDRGEQPGHLPQRAKLEDRVVERGLALEQDAPELQHHAEAERQRHRHRAHLARDAGLGRG